MSLANGTLYLAGEDNSDIGCYWTISTNGGTATEHSVSVSGYLGWAGYDPGGNFWCSGAQSSTYDYYIENGGAATYFQTATPWDSPGNMVFSGGSSFAFWGGNSLGGYVSNLTVVSALPGSAYYGGIAVNNGIIYIDGMDTSGTTFTVWVSSNNCASYNSIALNGTGAISYAIPFYSGSYLYVPGATLLPYHPCYWTINTSSGIATQYQLNYKNSYGGWVYSITYTNNTVYAAGYDINASALNSQQPACWINGNEIVLDSLGSSWTYMALVVTY